jgi:hypothetical protein
MGIFEDERGREAEELSFHAERAARGGDFTTARELFWKAAVLETQVARSVPDDAPRVRSVLAVSAVALWFKAALYSEAEKLGREFIEDPHVTVEARAELRNILDRCRDESRKLARQAS